MDFQTRQAIGALVEQIADLQDQVARVQRAAGTPQLPNASLTGGAIRIVHEDGTDRGSIGWQTDGTVAVVATNGPPPPAPSAPVVAAAQLALTVVWDGLFATDDDGDPETMPLDFDHVEVHLSTDSGFEPDTDSLRGTLRKPGALVCTPLLASTTYYAVLVGINTSGVAGDASAAVSGVPGEVVATDIIDGIVTTLKLADDAVTNSKIADTAVDANKLADGSVSAQKILDDAITAAKIDDGAVTAAALGADAVTAGKLADGSIDASTLFTGGVVDTTALDDDAVTADKIAANTIVAGNISAGAIGTTELAANAVVAGKIAANAITAGKIAAGIITAAEIATDTITASQIAAGAIGATELAANSVIAGKIAAGIVDATAIAAGAITTAKLDALAVTAANIAANAVTAGKINAGAVTAATLEATMIVATELRSTGYVAGVSGWRIGGGSGDAEFNDADFRGDVLVGPSSGPQIHVYSGSGQGRIDILSNDVDENAPGRAVSGVLGTGSAKRIQTNYLGARLTPTGSRPVIVQASEDLNGSSPTVSLGTLDSLGAFNARLTVDTFGVRFTTPAQFMVLNTSPTAAGDATWHAFSNGSWSSSFPYTRTCPSSGSIGIDIYMRANNRATVNATIGISVQIKAGSTVLWQPANTDTDSCALDQNDGTTAIASANYRRTQRTIIIGTDVLQSYIGQNITITPMYRVSSGTSYTYAAASLTIRDLPDSAISTVFS